MSNYTRQDDFGARDALNTGDGNKVIFGADLDVELDAVVVASATKEDSANKNQSGGYCGLDGSGLVLTTDLPTATTSAIGVLEIATDAEGITGTSDTRIMTPGTVTARLATPPAIGGTTPAAGDFTTLEGSAVTEGGVAVVTDDFVLTSGVGIKGGGDLTSNRTLDLDLENLTALTGAITATDDWVINDGTTVKKIQQQALNVQATDDADAHTFVDGDVNGVVYYTGSGNHAFTIGTGIGQDDSGILIVNSGSTKIQILGSSVTVNSASGDLEVSPSGMAVLWRETSTVWFLSGDLEA